MKKLLLCASLVGRVAFGAGDLVPVQAPPLGNCDDLDPAGIAAAIDHELPSVRKMSGALELGGRRVAWADYAKTLDLLAQLARQGREALCAGLAKRFDFYKNSGAGAGHFTIYYNPILRASRTKKGPFQYPLYRRPPGALANLTTAEVIGGALNGKGLELVYLSDPTEANAVAVEGSATVQLDDGSTISIGSDGNNGHPYTNVGKLVAADGKIPKNQITPPGMTRARKYFQDHPDELWVYWAKNPHYVWFKERRGGASGKFGELVAGRSLAVDPAFVPLGAATWIRTDMPKLDGDKVSSWVSYGRVSFAQDTGAGIKGAGRVDVFFGSGDYPQQAAQVTSRPGEIYVLLAK